MRPFVPGLIALFFLAAGATAETQTFVVDGAHTTVGFSVTHLMITDVSGVFEDFGGTITVDSDDLSTLSAEGSVKVASIQTRNAKRDSHLRSDDFFDAENHPEITFTTTGVEKKGEQWVASGELTIRGVTKTVEVPFRFRGRIVDPRGNEKVGFSATFVIDRQDYGISWNSKLDSGGVVVGDEVTIELAVEANLRS